MVTSVTSSGAAFGVLALQGDFEDHLTMLCGLGLAAREVRRAGDLAGLCGLVIPGGESSVMIRLLDERGMRPALLSRVDQGMAVMGTCAGAILLAREATPSPGEPLGLMDLSVRRNDYGRQVESFVTSVTVPRLGDPPLGAVFIRAPRVTRAAPDLEVMAVHGGDPVILLQDTPGRPLCLALSFHPELRSDARLHRFFADRVAARSSRRAAA